MLLEPTLDAVDGRGLLIEIGTLHLDRGYDHNTVRELCAVAGLDDVVIAKRRAAGTGAVTKLVSLGMRWPVEHTNSWLSNFGQLRRNTDRYIHHRIAQLCLAIALIITIKLLKLASRHTSHPNTPDPGTPARPPGSTYRRALLACS